MKNPLVSVLIPCYNAEHHLTDCLNSIQQQTFKDFEVILVDDGSSDNSISVIQSFNDSRFKIIQQKNTGIVGALNAGLKHCKGHYIARMDTDDLMSKNRLEEQISFFKANNCKLIGAQVNVFRDNDGITNSMKSYQDWSNRILTHQQIEESIFQESPLFHPTFFCCKSLFEETGGYKEVPWAEDYDLLLRLYNFGYKLGKVNKVLLEKRDHPQRLSRNDSRCHRPAMFQAKAHYFLKSGRLHHKKGLILIGTGASGKALARSFLVYHQKIAFFLDNKQTVSKRAVMNIDAFGMDESDLPEFFKEHKDFYFGLSISNSANTYYPAALQNAGLKNIHDFCNFT